MSTLAHRLYAYVKPGKLMRYMVMILRRYEHTCTYFLYVARKRRTRFGGVLRKGVARL